MANRLPWFPLYVDDYLNDTYDLSPCEHGVYLLLLSRFWVSGPLRDNLDALCRVAAGAPPQMVREILERFWELTGQGWVNPRMQAEMAKSEASSARAIAANQARWGKKPIKSVGAHIQIDNQMDSNPHPHPQQQQENPPTPRKKAPKHASDFPRFWDAYPRKTSKATAEKAWAKIDPDLADMIIADVTRRRIDDPQWREIQYVPHPSTYLNQRRWEDEILTAEQAAPKPRTREQWVRYGQERGIVARPGESWEDYLTRLQRTEGRT